MLIGFIGLHPEKGGILVECDLNHEWTVDSGQTTENSEEVNE
jgi:hypothetical protein